MNVLFASQCQLKAIMRTVRVLDAYAWRKGDRLWMASMTQEGLDTVRSELRRVATRQTAVACYVMRGLQGPRLAWTVGSKSAFGPNGEVPVGSTTVRRRDLERSRPALSPGLRLACLLATGSGLSHDLGKFGFMFQNKLRGQGPMRDAVRHDWLSFYLLLNKEALQSEDGWHRAWANAKPNLPKLDEVIRSRRDFSEGLRSAQAALEYLVFTHHRMPRDPGGKVRAHTLSEETYLDESQTVPGMQAKGCPSPETLSLRRTTISRINALVDSLDGRREDPVFWRAVASLARMGLILADHSVSSVNLTDHPEHGPSLDRTPGALFANTAVNAAGQNVLNQQLDWHLINVGVEAPRMLTRMLQFRPPGLSDQTLEKLREPAVGRFQWQSVSAGALRNAQAEERLATLVLNIAGTGCGKTRMNVLAVASLREGESVRIATGLNLRTLTLQTRDAYAKQLGMSKAELSCVIGCSLAVRLHEARDAKAAVPLEDEDGNPIEEEFQADGHAEPGPGWLDKFLSNNRSLSSVVMSPVVVCTADFLVKAGDPTEKANHALTSLRMMHSDLVLDEIDSYDPKALVAVMRLVTTAAMFGRHVVASSATLSVPVAKALHAAYELGITMGERVGLLEHGRWRQALIDDKTVPQLSASTGSEAFEVWFRNGLNQVLGGMGQRRLRPAELIRVRIDAETTQERRKSIQVAINDAVARMHQRHAWTVRHRGRDHSVSLGLVRIANIKNAVLVAKWLSAHQPSARVCCYHSQISRIHRYLIEKNLDAMLSRHPIAGGDPGARLLANDEVRLAIERSQDDGSSETKFIVVATPVEEIGRDHDFDWAIIEPSSTQSVVQASGRVNRHRLVDVDEPNIGVLQFNFAQADAESKLVFTRPGLECEISTGRIESPSHESHDLESLISWRALELHGQIDARLRYLTDVHPFALYDDRASAYQIEKHSARFMRSDKALWMGATTYDAVPLREKSNPQPETWTKNAEGDHLLDEASPSVRNQRVLVKRDNLISQEVVTHAVMQAAWLSWRDDYLRAQADMLELTSEQAFQVQLRPVSEEDTKSVLIEHPCFGYYKKKK